VLSLVRDSFHAHVIIIAKFEAISLYIILIILKTRYNFRFHYFLSRKMLHFSQY
jgi:hypothetical protein